MNKSETMNQYGGLYTSGNTSQNYFLFAMILKNISDISSPDATFNYEQFSEDIKDTHFTNVIKVFSLSKKTPSSN